MVAVMLMVLAGAAGPARATWYSENVAEGADLIMMDLRWPWWPSGTYYANWNSGFLPKPNNLSFYAGFTSWLADGEGSLPNPDEGLQRTFRPGSVWTFWGSDPVRGPVRFTDTAPNLYIRNDYGGEGSSGTTGAEPWRFVTLRRWYTMLARVWRDPAEPGVGHVGRWIRDNAEGRWHLIGTARLPLAVTGFTGNSGFIEPLTSEKAVRSLHRRLGYFRKDGLWQKSDRIAIDRTQYVVVGIVPEDGHEYVAIEYAQRPDLLPREVQGTVLAGDRKHEFVVRQPDVPVLDPAEVKSLRAVAHGGSGVVSWEVADRSSPQLGVKLEMLGSGGEALGEAVRRSGPGMRSMMVAVPAGAVSVRLTMVDAFDAESEPREVRWESVPVRPAQPAVPVVEGLTYELRVKDGRRPLSYFHPPEHRPDESHYWVKLDELASGKVVRTGLAKGFDLGVRAEREEGYAIVFRGLLRVPVEGLYHFRTSIDGAYRLTVGGTVIIERDGQWGTAQQSGWAALAAGNHEIVLEHVYDALAGRNFAVSWEGPGMAEQAVPVAHLLSADDGSWPAVSVAAQADGQGGAHVRASVSLAGSAAAAAVERTILYLDDWELARSDSAGVEYRGPLAAGLNRLRARVVFGAGKTVDSAEQDVSVSGPGSAEGWTVRNVGDAGARAGLWSAGAGAWQFFGNGMHAVTKPVRGDFTLTCRVDDYNGKRGEPVNRRAWVGLSARAHGERRNWEWGPDFHLVQTAADGLRSSADFTDFGGGRISSYALPSGRPWLRVMRSGNVWTAWTSVDGVSWELGALQFRRAPEEMEAGLFVSALPQEARAHYHCRISQLALREGVSAECPIPDPPVAQGTGGERLTGVVLARSDRRVVLVRSAGRGLWRSGDGGESWQDVSVPMGELGRWVRSVAVDPRDAAVMLCAVGDGKASALWKTLDAGRHWEPIDFRGDFDGRGPSALCGEVLAHDLRNPDIVYAGCESAGCFRSEDGGRTWQRLGQAGERITAVVVWPWEEHYPAPAQGRSHLCVCTCPDRWMRLLGRGEPLVQTGNKVSRGYLSPDGGKSLVVSDERDDTGFYHVMFDKALQSVNEMRYGTSHGVQSQVFAGSQMALYAGAKSLEWLRPVTALGAAAQGDAKFGRCFAQALDPVRPGRYSVSERWAFEWSWLESRGDVSGRGLLAVAGDVREGREWWFLHGDGLYWSSDGGQTVRRVLDETGQPVPR